MTNPRIILDLLQQEIKANIRLAAKVKKLDARLTLLESYVLQLQNSILKQKGKL